MRNYTITIIFTLLCLHLKAQYFDAGVSFGVMNYVGELVDSRMEPTEYNFACGGFLRYNITSKFSTKLMINGGTLTGTDALSGNPTRNLNFRSFIIEAGVQGEYNLFEYNILDGGHKISPYLFGGLTGFYFNPRATYKGNAIELQPLGTEGQGIPGYADKYNRVALSIPFGLGLKVAIHETSNIGFELGMRKTFTDFLDDVSGYYPVQAEIYEINGSLASNLSYRGYEYNQNAPRDPGTGLRGNPDTKDWYFYGGVTLSVNLGGGNKSFGKYPNKKSSRSQRFHSKNPWYGF